MKSEKVGAEEKDVISISTEGLNQVMVDTSVTNGAVQRKGVAIIKVPFGLGGAKRGAELGPDELIAAGLRREIVNLGLRISEEVRVNCPSYSISPSKQKHVKFLDEVRQLSERVCHEVTVVLDKGCFPLVLGGDHSVAIGTLAGLTARYSELGVIWFDAHADLNTEEHSLTGNMHGMSVAASLGHTAFNLSHIHGGGPFVDSSNLVYIGLRDLDEYEKERIRSLGIRAFTMHDVDRMGMERVIEQALNTAGQGTNGIHISFDMDCLDPSVAPGVGTPVAGGLSYREAHYALERLALTDRVTSMELVELNPLLDHNRHTAKIGVELIASLLGKRII